MGESRRLHKRGGVWTGPWNGTKFTRGKKKIKDMLMVFCYLWTHSTFSRDIESYSPAGIFLWTSVHPNLPNFSWGGGFWDAVEWFPESPWRLCSHPQPPRKNKSFFSAHTIYVTLLTCGGGWGCCGQRLWFSNFRSNFRNVCNFLLLEMTALHTQVEWVRCQKGAPS